MTSEEEAERRKRLDEVSRLLDEASVQLARVPGRLAGEGTADVTPVRARAQGVLTMLSRLP